MACRASLTSESGRCSSASASADFRPPGVCDSARGELPVLDLLGRRLRRLALPLAVPLMNVLVRIRYSHALRLVPWRELVERAVRLRESVLHQVLGVRRVAGHPHRRGVHLVQERQRLALEARGPLLGCLGRGGSRHRDREYRGLPRCPRRSLSRRHHVRHNTPGRGAIPACRSRSAADHYPDTSRLTHSNTASTSRS